MRMLLKAVIPVESGNRSLRDGSMQTALGAMMEQLEPEAAYFGLQDGQRCCFIFFDMKEPSDAVPLVQPFFLSLEADVELIPVMNIQDLQAGLEKMDPQALSVNAEVME